MIQQQTNLKVLDNSGAKTAKCIKILGGSKKKYATLGDFIVISVQQLRKKKLKKTKRVKKKEIYHAIVIKIKKKIKIKTGFTKNFSSNSVILLNKQTSPIATRILTSIPYLLKKKKLQKIINLSLGIT